MTASTQRLIDESNIQKLTAAYSHAIMRLDAQAAAATYAESGVLFAFYAPDIVGRQAIAEILTTLAPIQFICQTASSGVIDVDGDRARASWSITKLLRFRDKEELACCFACTKTSRNAARRLALCQSPIRALLPGQHSLDRQAVPETLVPA